MKVFSIRNWDEYFENAQSRRVENAQWVAVPNKHDGKSFRRLMRHPESGNLFTAWMLTIQVASKMTPRGVLVDDDGPLTPLDLEDKTSFPAKWFELAFEVLSRPEIGWLVVSESEHAPAPLRDDSHPAQPEGREGKEQKGREQKGREGGEEVAHSTPDYTGDGTDWLSAQDQFSKLWNACAAISSKTRAVLNHDLLPDFKRAWDPEWRPTLLQALERLREPLPGGKRFKLSKFLEQSTLEDLANGTHSWLPQADAGPSKLMSEEEKKNWRPGV